MLAELLDDMADFGPIRVLDAIGVSDLGRIDGPALRRRSNTRMGQVGS